MKSKEEIIEMVALLLEAPVGPREGLDVEARNDILKWSSPPTALNILHTLDICAYGSLASPFLMRIMSLMLQEIIKHENTTYNDVVMSATWREPEPQTTESPAPVNILPKMTVAEYVDFILTGDDKEVIASITKLLQCHSGVLSVFGLSNASESAQLTIEEVDEIMGMEVAHTFPDNALISMMLCTIQNKDKYTNRASLFDYALNRFKNNPKFCEKSIKWFSGLQ